MKADQLKEDGNNFYLQIVQRCCTMAKEAVELLDCDGIQTFWPIKALLTAKWAVYIIVDSHGICPRINCVFITYHLQLFCCLRKMKKVMRTSKCQTLYHSLSVFFLPLETYLKPLKEL